MLRVHTIVDVVQVALHTNTAIAESDAKQSYTHVHVHTVCSCISQYAEYQNGQPSKAVIYTMYIQSAHVFHSMQSTKMDNHA